MNGIVLVLGSNGFLGKNVCESLRNKHIPFLTSDLPAYPSWNSCDLYVQEKVFNLFGTAKPDYVLNCAAYVGGIQFGLHHQAELFHNNLLMTLNILSACTRYGTKRLVNPISNCAYPANATLFKEEEFWDGPLDDSVLSYGFARKASWVGSWAYKQQYGLDSISLILSNMFGPHDHFDPERSHAMGALIQKIVTAKEKNLPTVEIWGSGTPVREWLYVEDGAEAMVRAMNIPSCESPINIGVGEGSSITEIATIIKDYVGYEGKFIYDTAKIDGAPYKTVDGSFGERRMKWKPTTNFIMAIYHTIDWYKENIYGRN